MIDAYAHISLPRFAKAEELLRVLDRNGVERAIVATADTCPDLAELSRGAVNWPRRFRAVGMPLGESPSGIADAIRAQLDAGFLGIRLPDSLVLAHPELLAPIADAGRAAFVVGRDVFGPASQILLDFLGSSPNAVLALPHFAGVPDFEVFTPGSAAERLLHHPRMLIIFSRQGAYAPDAVAAWARWLIARIGTDRIAFGSEYPVCLWRDETYADTRHWLERVAGVLLTPEQSHTYFHAAAERLLFSQALAPAPLAPRFCRMDLRTSRPVWYFPTGTLDVPEETHRRLLAEYFRRGGDEGGGFRSFIASVLADAAASFPPETEF